jgi:hypothetical protein
MDGNEVVMKTPVVRPGSQPPTVKQEDTLMNKEKMTRNDHMLLIRCIDNYLLDYEKAAEQEEQNLRRESEAVESDDGKGIVES